MVNYRLIGTGVTNSQGVATCEYTGTGKGEVDFVASLDDASHISESSLQSETYELWDYLIYDKAMGNDKSTDWSSTNLTVTRSDEYYTLSGAVDMYKSTKVLTGDFEIVFEVNTVGNCRIGVVNANGTKYAYFFGAFPNWRYIKISRSGSSITAKYSSDGTNWTNWNGDTPTLTTEDCYFVFYNLVADRSISYCNLKGYSI